MTTVPGAAARATLAYRPVRPDELDACAEIWRVSTNDYISRLNQPVMDMENGPVVRLYRHLQATDPARFVVATQRDPAGAEERIVAFAAAVERERLWFLSMCFVLPTAQGTGIGRALVSHVAPSGADVVRATATDSAQPISNALYASLGIVPRSPLLNLVGLPEGADAFGPLPAGIQAIPFERVAGDDHEALVDMIDALDSDALGVSHPLDHRYLRQEGRRGWLYQGPDGGPLAYGYATEAGRVGPVASRDPDLLAPILGHLTTEVIPRGAFAMWLPGDADRSLMCAVRAGFRLEPFPVLLCWDRPFADLSRYLPISPGLL